MNKIILVTGATGGIGKQYSKEMLRQGYHLVLTYRNEKAGRDLQKELQQQFSDAKIDIMEIDLGSFDSIKSFAKQFLETYDRLDVLVHNAGVYFFDNTKRVSAEGIELHTAVHLVAPYMLTGLLFPLLEKTPHSKVISMSSTEHKGAPFNVDDLTLEKTFNTVGNMKAYSSSKFGLLVFTAELNRRLQRHNKGITALAAHPGLSITGIQHKGNPNGVQKFMIGMMGKFLAGKPEDAAKPLVLATTQGKAFEYYGPTGFKEAKGAPGLVKPDSRTIDENLGQNLWRELERVTQITYI